jgi:putative transposase
MYPNNAQATHFTKACGVARFAYNWALTEWKKAYALGEKVSEGDLRKRLNAVKRELFPWMMEVTKCAPQLAIKDLGAAFENFFKGRAKWPRFKKKGQHESFRISNDQFSIDGRKIRIPNLGWVRLAEALRFEGKVLGATVSKKVDQWFVAIQVEMPDRKPIHEGTAGSRVTVTWEGGQQCVTLDNGLAAEAPKPHKALLDRMRRLDCSLSRKIGTPRKVGKSRRHVEAKKKLALLHVRVANIRGDALHKLTTRLVQEYDLIRVENKYAPRFPVKRSPPRRMGDMSFFEFRRQLAYKGKITGAVVKEKVTLTQKKPLGPG